MPEKPPSLQQIAEIIDSFRSPAEKFLVSLCAFSGVPLASASRIAMYDFLDYWVQLGGHSKFAQAEIARLRPVRRTPARVVLPRKIPDYSETVSGHYSFLGAAGCGLLYRILALNYPDPSVLNRVSPPELYVVLRGEAAADRVRRRLAERGMTARGLRWYFKRSLAEARAAGKTSLTVEQIDFLAGDNALPPNPYLAIMDCALAPLWQPVSVNRLRKEYAMIEPEYFSIAGFPKKTDEPLGDITFPA